MQNSFLSIIQKSFQNWNEDNIPTWSAALSYFAVFAISPLLLLILSISSLILNPSDIQTVIFARTQELLGRNVAVFLVNSLQNARGGGGVVATIVGTIILIIGATGVFSQLKNTLNHIFKVKPAPTHAVKSFLEEKISGFLIITIIGLLLLISIITTAALSVIGAFFASLLPLSQFSLELGNFILTFLITMSIFYLTYRHLPDVNIPRKLAFKGALTTALLFTLGKTLFGLYLGLGTVGSGFGAAGALAVVLVWIYYSSLIFFFGAELIKTYAIREGIELTPLHNAVSTLSEEKNAQTPTWITQLLSLVVSGIFLRILRKIFKKKT